MNILLRAAGEETEFKQKIDEIVAWMFGPGFVWMCIVGCAAMFVLGAFRPPPPSKWCGTCGVDVRRSHHEPWCRKGRWGGSQTWRND